MAFAASATLAHYLCQKPYDVDRNDAVPERGRTSIPRIPFAVFNLVQTQDQLELAAEELEEIDPEKAAKIRSVFGNLG